MLNIRSSHPVKKLVIIIWLILALLGVSVSYWYLANHSLDEFLGSFIGVGVSWQSVSIVLAAYLLRTIIFIPLSVVLIATPLILGDFWASVLVAGIGEIISASLQFWLARIYGRDFIEESNNKTINLINEKITKFGSVSVGLLRLLPIPFDLINLGAGMTKMKFSDYFWVTVVSVWPDCVSYVAIGQSANSPISLLYTGGITLFVFLLLWYLKDHPEYKELVLLEVQQKTSVVKKKIKNWRKRKRG